MTPDKPPAPGWRLPFGLMVGSFIVLLDVSIVTVALPGIGGDLHADTSGMQWVVDAYTLTLSALLLSSGVLSDRYGRKRVYLGGIALFTLASVLCGAAPGIGVLIAARALQGVGAATVFTGTLSHLVQAYPDPRARARIVGINGSVGGSAIIVGPLLGGVLVDTVGWRGIFLINLPVGLAALWMAWRELPESADPEHASFDLWGQMLGLVMLGTLAFGLIETREHGWSSPVTAGPLTTAAVALVVFIWVERRVERPMLPVALFRDRWFTVPNVCSFVLGFGSSAVFFLLSLYLQQVRGHTAMETGVRFLPLTLAVCAVAPFATRLCGRYGAYRVMAVGYLVTGVALAGLVLLDTRSGMGALTAVSVVLGAGMGASIGPTQLAGVQALSVRRSGFAAACVGTTRQVGTALGVAVLGLMVVSHHDHAPGTPGFGRDFVAGLHAAGLLTGAATVLAAVLAAVSARAAPTPAAGGAAPAAAPARRPRPGTRRSRAAARRG